MHYAVKSILYLVAPEMNYTHIAHLTTESSFIQETLLGGFSQSLALHYFLPWQ
jgi:hypothetical protein